MRQLLIAVTVLAVSLGLLAWARSANHPSWRDPARIPPALLPDPRPLLPAAANMNELARPIHEVDLKQVRLKDALDYIGDVTGVNVVVDWNSLQRLGLAPDSPITLKLHDASAGSVVRALLLPTIPTAAHAVCLVEGNILLIRAGDGGDTLETHVYDVREIITSAIQFHGRWPTESDSSRLISTYNDEQSVADALADIVRQTDPAAWLNKGGTTAQLSYFAGHFVVKATPEHHVAITRLLGELRGRK